MCCLLLHQRLERGAGGEGGGDDEEGEEGEDMERGLAGEYGVVKEREGVRKAGREERSDERKEV